MAAIELLIPSATRSDQRSGKIGHYVRGSADPLHGDFAATLLAMAGHDLRQPLQLITSAHDVLATMLHNDKQREELAEAAAATARLARMLGQLVEALQLQEQAAEALNTPVRLRPILEDLMMEFDEPARIKGLTLRVTSAGGIAVSHPVLLTSMLRNLIRNAIDYTPAGGSVSIATHQRGSELLIDVGDTGTGIHANALSTIFAAFQRADESRPEGLGLGLFIVKRAADLLGHRIEVHSVEERGSRFTIVARAAQPDASEVSRSKAAIRFSKSTGSDEWRRSEPRYGEPKFIPARSAL